MERLNTESAAAVLRQINRAWLDGRVDDMAAMVHPEVVMVGPGFAGKSRGRAAFLAGFCEFLETAKMEEFREFDHQVDEVGSTAVASFRFEMIYARDGGRYLATGRDVWVFQNDGGAWTAVWRTMLDMDEKAV